MPRAPIAETDRFSRYRATQRRRGLKLLRIWVPDVSAPGFRAEAERQAQLINAVPDANETGAFIENRARRPRHSALRLGFGWASCRLVEVRRGDVVTVAVPADYGKPRPAVVVQSDALAAGDSVLVALMSSHQVNAPLYRLTCPANPETGLRTSSDVLVEKIVALPRSKVGGPIGRLGDADMLLLNRMIAFVLGLADPA